MEAKRKEREEEEERKQQQHSFKPALISKSPENALDSPYDVVERTRIWAESR